MFPRRWEKAVWMGKMSSTDDHILGTPSGRQLARTVKRRPEHERWCQALFALNVFTSLEPKLSLLPAEQAPRQVGVPDTRSCGKVWIHGCMRAEPGWKNA